MKATKYHLAYYSISLLLLATLCQHEIVTAKPAEELSPGSASSKLVVLELKKDAEEDPYKSLAERILRTVGYQIVGKKIKQYDAAVRIEAETYFSGQVFRTLDGLESDVTLMSLEIRGKIKFEVPKSEKWNASFKGIVELPEGKEIKNPSPQQKADLVHRALGEPGSFTDAFLHGLVKLTGAPKLVVLLNDENPMVRRFTARVLKEEMEAAGNKLEQGK